MGLGESIARKFPVQSGEMMEAGMDSFVYAAA